jgi:pimeloyl-ACP methyl ester carboxylesterase
LEIRADRSRSASAPSESPATTRSFSSWDGIEIAYQQWGEPTRRPPVVLHHGFAADANANWVVPGVVDALLAAGRHVIAPDARGHGRSQKPHDRSYYGEGRMARDLGCMLDLIGPAQIDLVGYSMGAIVSLIFSSEDQRVRRLVVGGVGSGVIECGGVDRRAISNESIIEALSVEDASTLAQPGARAFRALADALGADRKALVAQARSVYRGQIALDRISAPTLVLAGDEDPLAIRPGVLADALPDATLRTIPGNHIAAVADPSFTRLLVDFLA